jgi:hypothetical protein
MNVSVNDSSLLSATSVVKLLEYTPAFCSGRYTITTHTLLHRFYCSNTKSTLSQKNTSTRDTVVEDWNGGRRGLRLEESELGEAATWEKRTQADGFVSFIDALLQLRLYFYCNPYLTFGHGSTGSPLVQLLPSQHVHYIHTT